MKIIINDVSTNYQMIGKKGPILLLLHGWGGNWQSWAEIIPELSEKYQLIIPDIPSFGNSTEPEKVWDLDNFADWLDQFIRLVVDKRKLTLLAHSFGGQISSVYVSKNQPKNLIQLILVDSAGLVDELSQKRKIQERIFGLIPDFTKQIISNKFKRKVLEVINSPTDHLNSSYYQRKVLKKVVKTRIEKELTNIKVLTLLIWGENDAATPIHQAKQFHKLIKNSKLKILENSGHFPFIDQKDEFVKIIESNVR